MDTGAIIVIGSAFAGAVAIISGATAAVAGSRLGFLRRSVVIPRTHGMRAQGSPWPIDVVADFVEDFVMTWERLDAKRRGSIREALRNVLIRFEHDERTYADDGFGRKVRGLALSPRHAMIVTWRAASVGDTALAWELCRLVMWNLDGSPGGANIAKEDGAIRDVLREMRERWGSTS